MGNVENEDINDDINGNEEEQNFENENINEENEEQNNINILFFNQILF